MDSLLEGELNTHRDDCMVASPPPMAKKKRAPRGVLALGGPQEKMSFFQIASGPILSIPFHLKVCQYDPCKVSLKKNDPFLTYEPPKVSIFRH